MNPSNRMTKNLVEKLHTKHANMIYEGLLWWLAESPNMEDVRLTIESNESNEVYLGDSSWIVVGPKAKSKRATQH